MCTTLLVLTTACNQSEQIFAVHGDAFYRPETLSFSLMRVFGTRANCWCPYSSVNNWCPNHASETEQSFLRWMFAAWLFSYPFFCNCNSRQYLWLKESSRQGISERRMWVDSVLRNWVRMLKRHLPPLWTQFGVSSHMEAVRIHDVSFNVYLNK